MTTSLFHRIYKICHKKQILLTEKFVGSHGINPLLTREVLSTYKKKLHLHGKKSVVDIEITQASSVLELLPKKQKNVMCQNLSLTW